MSNEDKKTFPLYPTTISPTITTATAPPQPPPTTTTSPSTLTKTPNKPPLLDLIGPALGITTDAQLLAHLTDHLKNQNLMVVQRPSGPIQANAPPQNPSLSLSQSQPALAQTMTGPPRQTSAAMSTATASTPSTTASAPSITGLSQVAVQMPGQGQIGISPMAVGGPNQGQPNVATQSPFLKSYTGKLPTLGKDTFDAADMRSLRDFVKAFRRNMPLESPREIRRTC